MLREEIETVKTIARAIAKAEIAAIPKPEDPLKNIESLIRKIVKEEIEKAESNKAVFSKSREKGGR